ncbi:MAG TPA: YqgE/AlgH family protein [Pseudomonadota bacterium]|nr:YqgE/AlgH family protein [Pseudomonadota bacterium]
MTAEDTSADKTSLKGSLLIAMPTLQDPNFHRRVTLLISHNEQGALGIVLGAPTTTPIREVCAQFNITWARPTPTYVRSGGPCEGGRIWLVHGGATPLPDAVTITPGIHIGSSPQLLRTLAERPKVQKALGGGPASPNAQESSNMADMADMADTANTAATAPPVMVFGGYAGWGPGQLEAELQHKSWLPSFGEIDADLVFATAPDKVWEAALAAMALSPGHIVSGSGASA